MAADAQQPGWSALLLGLGLGLGIGIGISIGVGVSLGLDSGLGRKKLAHAPLHAPLHAVGRRLRPGEDVKEGVLALAKEHGLAAGVVVSAVGSCEGAVIRLANADRDHPNEVRTLRGKFEILSLIGTVAASGAHHLHVSLGDFAGNVFGGHLVGDMPVFTTCEVVIAECSSMEWHRVHDDCTGFAELQVCARPPPTRSVLPESESPQP